MAADRIIIEELSLQMPGLSTESARAIAAEVAERVGAGVAAAMPKRSLGALELRLELRQGAGTQELVDVVARRILEALLK